MSFAFLDPPRTSTPPSSTPKSKAEGSTIPVHVSTIHLVTSTDEQGTVLAKEDKTTAFPTTYIGIAIGAIFIILLAVAFMFYKRYLLLVPNIQSIQNRLFFIKLHVLVLKQSNPSTFKAENKNLAYLSPLACSILKIYNLLNVTNLLILGLCSWTFRRNMKKKTLDIEEGNDW